MLYDELVVSCVTQHNVFQSKREMEKKAEEETEPVEEVEEDDDESFASHGKAISSAHSNEDIFSLCPLLFSVYLF